MLAARFRKNLKNFSLEMTLETEAGQILVLFGPSGSGKSLALRLIAGLERPDTGRIVVGGQVVFDSSQALDLPLQQRRVGYVPQNYALFPHFSVQKNIGYGLQGQAATQRVSQLVTSMRLQGLEKRKPREISGGQQQRVALARALAIQPALLLLDEPFSALDAIVREQLREDLREIHQQFKTTTVFVTHDLSEAFMLADRIAVFEGGRVLQCASRSEIFQRPISRAVAQYTGGRNLLAAQVTAKHDQSLTVRMPTVNGGGVLIETPFYPFEPGTNVTLMIRPEQLSLTPINHSASETDAGLNKNRVRGTVVGALNRGTTSTVYFQIGSNAGLTNQYDLELLVLNRDYTQLESSIATQFELIFSPAAVHLMK